MAAAVAKLGTRSPGEDAGTESEVVEAMQAALDLGANIDAVDNNGETAMHGAAYKNLPGAVEFLLAAKGAKIEIWNQKNKHGWTPLTIAEGYRFGNFKPSFVTVAAFHKVMAKPPASSIAADPAGVKEGIFSLQINQAAGVKGVCHANFSTRGTARRIIAKPTG